MQKITILFLLFSIIFVSCGKNTEINPNSSKNDLMEIQVEEYIEKFPYQDTYNYSVRYTGGDIKNYNKWVLGAEPALVKAGEDKVVRMNNDTYYKMAFVVLNNGPVYLNSSAPSVDRFSSFQLMDDRNANYRNVIRPYGKYTLYYGDKPSKIEGEAIKVPSELSVILVRVEVKDKNDIQDLSEAKKIFNGITINGPGVESVEEVTILSEFDESIVKEANKRLDDTFSTVPFRKTVVGPGQEPGKDVPYLYHSAGTKGGWGGPDTSHSSYETIFYDIDGNEMIGSKGPYTVTTEEPPVDAFWSITVYDSDRGGFLHPNKYDRYHINNTGAVVNDDGTITFLFKQNCLESDLNCLEVPPGRFDLTARYYLPHEEIISGEWTLPKIEKQ